MALPEPTGGAAQRAEEDLQAQKSMSFWAGFAAMIAVIIGPLSVVVGVFGVVFVRETLEATRKQLVAAQRPWLKVQTSILGGLSIEGNTVHISFRFKIENIGTYPASNIWLESKLSNMIEDEGMPNFSGTDPRRKLHKMIEEAKVRPDLRYADFLFPNESIMCIS